MHLCGTGRTTVVFVFAALAICSGASVQKVLGGGIEVEWALRAGGDGADKIRGLAIADDGSIFLTGEFGQPSADFFGEKFASAGLLDFVVTKLNPDGSLLWSSVAGGAKIDRGYGVAPSSDGGCFVTGHFESAEINFGNSQLLTSRGDYDAFVARYGPEGKCLWAFACGGAGYDYGHGIDVDHKGGCVVSGAFAASGHFGDTTFVHPKGRRAFLMRVADDGDIRWVREAGSDTGTMSGHNVCSDSDGNVFLAGFQRGGASFSNSVSLPGSSIQDVFVARFSLQGDAQWVVGTGGESDGLATSVASDGSGGCYIGGMFKGELNLARATLVSGGGHDAYVARIDSAGNGLWAYQIGGAGTDYGLGVAVAGNGKDGCVLTGELTDRGTFHGKGSKRQMPTRGERDAYVAGYGADGELRFVELLGGKDNDLSYAIGVDENGAVVISGAFRNETRMGALNLISRKGNDIFVTRLTGAK